MRRRTLDTNHLIVDHADLQALSGPPEVVAQAIRAFADEGIDHIQAYMVPSTIESVEWLAKVIEILDQ